MKHHDPELLRQTILTARNLIAEKLLYLDTETTGLEHHDEIIEIAIMDDDGQPVINSLVKPAKARVSDSARRVHHISDSDLVTAPTLAMLWPQIEQVTFQRSVLIYNKDFDLGKLRRSLWANGVTLPNRPEGDLGFFPWCVMNLYAEYWGEWNSYRQSYRWQTLDRAVRQCGIKQVQDHRALGDCQLTRLVLHHMAEQPLPETDPEEDEYPF